jgi:DNA-binding transcriptional ArsR family regulator
MRPLFHPPADSITLEGVLHALSDPVRLAIFASVALSDCPQNCTIFAQISEQTVPKSTLSQHFKVLRDAGLIRSERQGVEMRNISRCPEIEQRFPGLLTSILTAYKKQASSHGSG